MTLFPEEQLDSPVGYFAGYPGLTLQSGKWIIVSKLGWGKRSSVWLVYDASQPNEFRAVKIFTLAESKGATASNEHRILRTDDIQSVDIVQLQASFREGGHLCLVFLPHGTTVEQLRKSNAEGGYVAAHIAKQIASSTLTAVSSLEDINLFHGNIATDHIVIGELTEEDIMAAGIETSVELITINGLSYPLVRSQPIDPEGWETTWNEAPLDFAGKSLFLINVGHATQPTQDRNAVQAMKPTTSVPFPPEVLLGHSIALSSDIWQLGWMIFLLLTGTPLLDQDTYLKSPIESLNRVLEAPVLETRLLCNPTLLNEDREPTVTLLRSLLAADPSLRPIVEDLLDNRWIQQGDLCTCGACAADKVVED